MDETDDFDPKTCVREPGGFWKYSNWKWLPNGGWSANKRWVSEDRIGYCMAIGEKSLQP